MNDVDGAADDAVVEVDDDAVGGAPFTTKEACIFQSWPRLDDADDDTVLEGGEKKSREQATQHAAMEEQSKKQAGR